MSSSDDMTALTADFPGWHIWRSRSPRGNLAGWHATRKRGAAGRGTGRLAAADAAGLRALLAQQDALVAA